MKLDQIIPNENVRKVIYSVFGGIGLILSVIQSVYASQSLDQPGWLVGAFAAYGVLAAAGFTVSLGNTPSASPLVTGTGEVAEVELGEEVNYVFTPEETPTAGSDPAADAKHASGT